MGERRRSDSCERRCEARQKRERGAATHTQESNFCPSFMPATRWPDWERLAGLPKAFRALLKSPTAAGIASFEGGVALLEKELERPCEPAERCLGELIALEAQLLGSARALPALARVRSAAHAACFTSHFLDYIAAADAHNAAAAAEAPAAAAPGRRARQTRGRSRRRAAPRARRAPAAGTRTTTCCW